jgi:flavodoxin short chain
MAKVNIVFWTQSGNTQAMAEAMAEGAKAAGAEANAVFVSDDILAELKDAKVFALGCPAMGDEVLEESEMEPFVAAVEGFASGKTIALFGSYGWGDGQWMTDWVDRMKAAGATVLNDEGIICNGEPDDDIKAALEAAGKALAGLA